MKIGSLFSGYGGLDLGVQAVLGGEVAWHVEFDAAPSKILAHHWPDVPNYGDITTLDFTTVEPVDVLTGGFPCQDLSLAGRRAGMRPGTRSGLWADFLRAIDTIRPQLAVIENVRGLLSGCAESDLESCPGCVGNGEHRPPLRALGRVLGDLADIGYDARWVGLRAADAGAPHGRFRVFVLASPRNPEGDRGRVCFGPGSEGQAVQGFVREARGERRVPAPRQSEGGRAWSDAGRRGGASATDTAGPRRAEGQDGGASRSNASEGSRGLEPERARGERAGLEWGSYSPVVQRWESILGRNAPDPTVGGRLSPVFVEWMMGLPAGHVTDVGLKRTEQLKALGNGVVPQQAALALRLLLSHSVLPSP